MSGQSEGLLLEALADPGDAHTATVRKETDPANAPGLFTILVQQCSSWDGSTSSGSCVGTWNTVPTGTANLGDNGFHVAEGIQWEPDVNEAQARYRVIETVPSGWELTSVDCDGAWLQRDIADGKIFRLDDSPSSRQSIDCTFENEEIQPATITARKGGSRHVGFDTEETFVNPLAGAYFEKSDDDGVSWTDLCGPTNGAGTCEGDVDPDTYLVREKTTGSQPAGYSALTSVTSTDPRSPAYVDEVTVGSGDDEETRWFVNRHNNPAGPTECGIKIALLLDRSGSISDFASSYEAAAKSFVSVLQGTPTELSIYSFAASASDDHPGFLDLSVPADVTTANSTITSIYSSPSGSTNWDDAFQSVTSAGADIVVVITDGNPTVWEGGGTGNTTQLSTIEAGVASANDVKAAGQQVLAVGVDNPGPGGSPSVLNLNAVSSPDDTYTGSLAELQQTLKDLADKFCGSTVTITKKVDGVATDGWTFATTDPLTGTVSPLSGQSGDAGTGQVVFQYSDLPGWAQEVTITETLQAGHSFVGVSNCVRNGQAFIPNVNNGAKSATFDITRNDIISCTFNNEANPGQITVVKETVGGFGGPFTFQLNGGDNRPVTTDAANTPKAADPWTDLTAGNYAVTESALPQFWQITGTPTCVLDGSGGQTTADPNSVPVGPGQSWTCTFQNEKIAQPGSVTVKKKTIGDTGTFNFTLTGQSGSSATTTNETSFFTATPVWNNLTPGHSYTLGEVGQAAWVEGTFTCNATGQNQITAASPVLPINDGENWTCEITNHKRPKIIIEKAASPADDTTFPFTGDLGGFTLQDPSVPSKTFQGAPDDLVPDTYTVAENLAGLTGWELDDIDCDTSQGGSTVLNGNTGVDITVGWGDVVTCTFVNEGSGSVKVIKVTDPPNQPGPFPVTLTEFPVGPDTYSAGWNLPGGGDDHTFNLVPAGVDLSLTEADVPGWELTGSNCVNEQQQSVPPDAFQVQPGETVVCTLTNTKDGSITIVKETNPDDGGPFEFAGPDGDFELSDNGSEPFTGLQPGSYDFSETELVGWELTDIDCGNASVSDLGETGVRVNLAAGQNVTCTFTNTKDGSITIVKETNPDDGGPFEFAGPDGDFELSDNGSEPFTGLQPGSYDFSETELVGWELTDIDCGNASVSDLGETGVRVNLAAGQNVTCTFTNTKDGSITIVKETNPDDGGPFEFAGPDGDFELSDNGSEPFTGLQPGSYDFSETELVGWELTDIDCGNASVSDLGETGVRVNLAAGQNVTCTFTNTKDGSITIVKETNPDDGGPFEFAGPDGDFELSDNGSEPFTGLQPGSYDFSETELVGWELTDIDCGNASVSDLGETGVRVNLAAGQNVTCTFTNTKDGSITIVKETNPDDGGPFEFAGPDGDFELSDNGSEPFTGLQPGSYDFSETELVGWELTDIDCGNASVSDLGETGVRVNLAAGQNVTCTFTNTKDGSITIVKETNPDDGGPFEFAGPDGDFELSDNGSEPFTGLQPGSYDFSETELVGWELTDIDCGNASVSDLGETGVRVNLAAGQNVTCTFTNTKDGSITIVKETNPDDGGPFEFAGPDGDFELSDNGSEPFTGLQPGSYDFSETELVGWELTDIDCGNASVSDLGETGVRVNLAAGQNVTCTFTNTKDGSITIVKETNPDDGGPFEFAGPDGDFELSDNGSEPFTGLQPGSYDFSETELVGWELTDIDCGNASVSDLGETGVRVNLAAGQNVTCTFTNTKDGSITIVKETNPDDGGPFEFAGPDGDFELSDNGSEPFTGLQPGSYDFSETELVGWELTDIDCGNASVSDLGETGVRVNLAAGQNVTCTFTNTKDGSITIVKETNPDDGGPFEFAGPDGDFELSDNGSEPFTGLQPGSYDFSETELVGWELTDIDCGNASVSDLGETGVRVNLAAGQNVTCTFTNTKDGSITIVKETNPDDGGPFEFAGPDGDFELSDNGSEPFTGLQPGSYDFSETELVGWELTDIDCGNASVSDLGETGVRVNLAAGQNVTCTFTNTKDGQIVLNKQTTTPNDEDTSTFDFTGDIVANDVPDDGLVGKAVAPGQYTVTETDPGAQWSLYDIVCDDGDSSGNVGNGTATYNVAPGETVKCTFYNGQAEIEVAKTTVTPNDDDETEFSFTGDITADLVGGESSSVYVGAGSTDSEFHVTEGAADFWTLEGIECGEGGSGDVGTRRATYTVQAGDSVSCEFTNGQAEINVAKEIVTESGADPEFGFTGDIAADLHGGEDAGLLVPSGETYTTTEAVVDGWQLTDIACGDGGSGNLGNRTATYEAGAGETITCTFENTQDAQIIVDKTTIPAGSEQGFDFDLKLGDDIESEVNGLTDGTEGSFGFVTPNKDYSVVEDVPEGWQQTAAECVLEGSDETVSPTEVTPLPGQVWRCSFENTQEGSITVVKDTGGIEPGQEFPFTFQGDPFGLVDQQSQTFDGLLPGEFEVLEPADLMPQYWQLAAVECVSDHVANGEVDLDAQLEPVEPDGPADVTEVTDGVQVALAAGENVTCTFANVQVFPAPGVTITKTPSITSGSPGDTVTYTYVVENTGQARLDNVKVVDDKLGEITLDKTTLEPGEKATGTKDYVLKASDVGNLVNVAVVTADPEGGQDPVTADDDAVVEVVQVQDEPPVTKPPAETGSLPFTGATIAGMLLAALAMLIGGSFLWATTKRRRREVKV